MLTPEQNRVPSSPLTVLPCQRAGIVRQRMEAEGVTGDVKPAVADGAGAGHEQHRQPRRESREACDDLYLNIRLSRNDSRMSDKTLPYIMQGGVLPYIGTLEAERTHPGTAQRPLRLWAG